MGDGKKILYEIDGRVVADVRSADELAQRITLFPGWAVVEKVKMSEASRGGIILPNPEVKDQQHLMLYKVAVAGPAKKDKDGHSVEMRATVGAIVVLKPSVAQFLMQQRHEFGVVQDGDIIGIAHFDEAPEKESEDEVSVDPDTVVIPATS